MAASFVVLAILVSRSVVIAVGVSKRLHFVADRLDPRGAEERFASSRYDIDNDDGSEDEKQSAKTDNTCITARGGDTAKISCPGETVISGIAFASFGTPSGTCGDYHLSPCHASTSEHVLKNLCLSRSTCNIRAVPETFGAYDACRAIPTTSKELVIEYACDKPGKVRSTKTAAKPTTTTPAPAITASKLSMAPRESIRIGSGGPALVLDSSTTLFRCQWEGYPDQLEKYLADSNKYDVDQLYYGRSRTQHYFQHIFSAGDCGGTLPSGYCFASFRRAQHCGPDQGWSILHPQDEDGPAVLWYNEGPCIPNEGRDPPARIAVDYVCPSHLEAPHLHQCMFEGRTEELNGTMLDPHDPTAGTYFAKRFDASECTNGLPPLKEGNGASCISSITWMEHCGDEHDWMFNPAVEPATFLKAGTGAPVLRWYTAHDCDSVRVGMDFFCPMDVFKGGQVVAVPKDHKETDKALALPQLHRCSANVLSLGLLNVSSDTSDAALQTDLNVCARVHSMAYYDGYNARGDTDGSLPNLVEDQVAGCRYVNFSASDCLNGLPPANATCAVSLHAMAECGREQDWDAEILAGSVASVRWYNALGNPCSKATVAVDYYCPRFGGRGSK